LARFNLYSSYRLGIGLIPGIKPFVYALENRIAEAFNFIDMGCPLITSAGAGSLSVAIQLPAQ
jgi:hypothetical protein